MREILLALLMGMTPYSGDTETKPERRERMKIVAIAMTDAIDQVTCFGEYDKPDCKRRWRSGRKNLAAALLVQGENESHFAYRIHSGNCNRDECDATRKKRAVRGTDGLVRMHIVRGEDGKPVVWHAARSIWQVQSTADNLEIWHRAEGLSLKATTAAAQLSVNYLSVSQCGGSFEQMFTAQDGNGCGRVKNSGKFRAGELRKYVRKYEIEARRFKD